MVGKRTSRIWEGSGCPRDDVLKRMKQMARWKEQPAWRPRFDRKEAVV